jgi:hypothetical protein
MDVQSFMLQAPVATILRQGFNLGMDNLDAGLPADILEPAHIRDDEGFEAINVVSSDLLIAPLTHSTQDSVVSMGISILEIDNKQGRISGPELGIG